MHAAALQALGLAEWRYQFLPAPPDVFDDLVRGLPHAGFRGANVTIPHKERALALASEATQVARGIGAANTLTFDADGAVHADNTDAPGFLAALPFNPRGRTALVLGAGGSARAVVWALQGAGAEEVSVWNRSPQRARELADELGARAVENPKTADLLVNCTSVGLGDSAATFKDLALRADELDRYACVIDLIPRRGGTALLAAARALGTEVVDGMEVLVHQGALSLERWTGRMAPVDVMRAAAGAED
jgi:shikimate dehydrogenase